MKKISIFFSLFRGKIQIGSNEPARNAKAMRHIRALFSSFLRAQSPSRTPRTSRTEERTCTRLVGELLLLVFRAKVHMRISDERLHRLCWAILLITTALGCDNSNSASVISANSGSGTGSMTSSAGGGDSPTAGNGSTVPGGSSSVPSGGAGNSPGTSAAATGGTTVGATAMGGTTVGATATGGTTVGGTATGGTTVGGTATGGTTVRATATGGTTVRATLPPNNAMTNCEAASTVVQTQRIEAECAFGATTGNCKGNTGGQQGTQLGSTSTVVGYIASGDYLYYNDVVLDGITTMQIHYSKGVSGGTMEVHLDSPTGQLLGSLTPAQTNSWDTWGDATLSLTATSGTHALYLVFSNNTQDIVNLDWFQVSGTNTGAAPMIHMNQVGFDTQGGKHAVVEGASGLSRFLVVGDDGTAAWCGDLTGQSFDAWGSNNTFYSVDFTELTKPGNYRLQIGNTTSAKFTIAGNALFAKTFPSVLGYFKSSRADDSDVWGQDASIPVCGTGTSANVQGGWYDASGDISKYLTHLSYTNFMNPQQIPLVAWALGWVYDQGASALATTGNASAVQAEALWGADYLVRVLDPSRHFFYTTVFDGWSGNVGQRQICAFSGQYGAINCNYQSSLREGGGMAIAALARAAHWGASGAFTSAQYLSAAQDAFAYLNTNGVEFDDDGKENIIDDYGGLLAAVELYATTQTSTYLEAARSRTTSLVGRLGSSGYFIADGASRPFWHGSDAGLPVVALVRYVQVETDATRRNTALQAIQTHLDYLVTVTRAVTNPYGYARQPISASAVGFFIPHQNESEYWWQGENARLGSLAAAALLGANVLGASGTKYTDLLRFAGTQLDWILGANPYDMCFLKGFGTQNPEDYQASKSQAGTLVGGIANGITGSGDEGSGIAYGSGAAGSAENWRWVEQWLPHSAWYMVAITAQTQ